MNKFRAGDLKVVVEERTEYSGITESSTRKTVLTLAVFASSQLAKRTGLKERLHVGGWIFDASPRGRDYAERMRKCVEAGKLYEGYTVETDVRGQKYISTNTNGFFHKRHMNASLQALGF